MMSASSHSNEAARVRRRHAAGRWRVTFDAPVTMVVASIASVTPSVNGAPRGDRGVATFHALGDFPGGDFYSLAMDVSDDGSVVVGVSEANAQMSGSLRAYRWTEASGMVMLPHPGSTNVDGWARSISGDGSVILLHSGGSFLLHPDGSLTEIGSCGAIDFSTDATIVVGSTFGGAGLEASMWTEKGGCELFGDIGGPGDTIDSFFSGISDDGAVACGQSMVDSPSVEPTIWTAEEGMVALGDVPGGLHYGLAWAISGDGTTIVGDAIGDVSPDAWRWSADTGLENLELAEPGVTQSTVASVSHDGSLIGGHSNVHGAMLWTREHGMRSLQTLLAEEHGLELSGWTLVNVMAMSADGRALVGHGKNPNGKWEAYRVVLPPPSVEGDVNGDGVVDGADITAILGVWETGDEHADLNDDGVVNGADMTVLLGHWTASPS